LTRLLGLSACRFQDGAAGIGNPPRLLRDGRIVTAGQTWDVEVVGLPPGRDTELLAEAGGLLQGRFLLTPCPKPARAWNSAWSPSALPTMPEPRWPTPG
jgi:hypothetical protein